LPLDKPTPAAPAALTPLFQLPPPPADFTGRTAELRELRAAIEKGGVHISGLQGQGGVGKTALALKLAEDLAPNFPDAQIYLDLKGVSEKPLTAAEAMSHVLRTFHPEAKLPEKEEDLRALYLSVLHNKRVLLLMDNAKDAAQVQPLIPPEGCTLLVTSRLFFYLRDIEPKNLDTLPAEDATKLLLRIAPRIEGEADAIARSCGYLPLALCLAATAIAERRDLEPAEHRKNLADETKRLKLLTPTTKGIDPSVEASISLSYKLLDAETQDRWRMLAVFPDTFDSAAAAAVWEIDTDAAQQTLGGLLQFSMLEWNEATKRYRLHDLMRDFARQRLTPVKSAAAALRHASHYCAVVAAAEVLYLGGGASIMRGLALFDFEWGNIQTGQAWTAANSANNSDSSKLCSEYPNAGINILLVRQRPREQIRWLEAALASARQLKDRAAEGSHLGNLGIAYRQLGEYNRAIECNGQQLAFAREVGNRRGEGNALGSLGLAHADLGDHRRAIEYYEQALTTYREIGDHRGEGATLGNLAVAHRNLGDHRRAIEYGEKALVIVREIGDRLNEGIALGNLGNAYVSLGEAHRAIDYFEQRIVIAREIGDRRGEGSALSNMSGVIYDLGDHKQAIAHAEAALKIFEEIEHPKAAKFREQLDIWRNG
jgi:tetratricopeptide (TPR) repeat protein